MQSLPPSLPSPSLVSFPVNDLFPAGFLAVYIEQKHNEIVLVSARSNLTVFYSSFNFFVVSSRRDAGVYRNVFF